MSRVNCPNCGQAVWTGAVACKHCGMPFGPAPPPVYYQPPPPDYYPPPVAAPPYQTPPEYGPYEPPYQTPPDFQVNILPPTKNLLDSAPSGGGEERTLQRLAAAFIALVCVMFLIAAIARC